MENAIYLLYDLCRLCLDAPGTHNIFESDNLIRDIFSYTGILHISCNDKLPKTVCTHCVYKIKAAKDLKDYATRNDLYMRSLLDSNKASEHEIARPKISVKPMEEVVSSSTENKSTKCEKKKPKVTEKDDNSNILSSSYRESKFSNIKKKKPKFTEKDDNCNIQSSSSTENKDRPPKTEKKKPKEKDKKSEKSNSQKTPSLKSPVKKVQNPEIHRPRISVRSLEDINSGRCLENVISGSSSSVVTSSEKDNTSRKVLKRSNSVSSSDNKTEDNVDHNKCETPSAKDKTSHKIIKRSNSVTSSDNKTEDDINHNKCEICNKTFLTWKKLYLHHRSHSKNFNCPLDACGKRFATKGDLQKHIRAHTGEKPYRCDLCDKRFTQNVTLKSHKETVHEAKRDEE